MRHWYGPGPKRRSTGRRNAARPAWHGLRLPHLAWGKALAWLKRRGAHLGRTFGKRGGGSAMSIAISLGVHVALVALFALALRGVVTQSGQGGVRLELVLGGAQTPASTASPVDVVIGEASARTDELSFDPQGRLAREAERVASAPVAVGAGVELPRGATSESFAGLLDRGLGVASEPVGNPENGLSHGLDGASFAGVSAQRARSVVYSVDASGAMVTSLPFVLEELRRSVSALAPDQRFAVVLFGRRVGDEDSAAGVRVYPEAGMLAATPANKASLYTWLDGVEARGASNPLDGLLAAIDREPEVVFLLSRSIRRTDGRAGVGDWGPGREAILAELERANPVRRSIFGPPGRAVQVKCVQFLEEDPTGVMPAIADVHGGGPGSYRLLPESELRRR